MDRLGIGLVARGVAGEEEEVGPRLPHQELHQRIGAHGAAERRVEDVREAGGDAQVVVADAAVEDQRVRCLGMYGDGQQVIAWQIGDEEAAPGGDLLAEDGGGVAVPRPRAPDQPILLAYGRTDVVWGKKEARAI